MKDAQIALRELDGKLMGGTKVSVCLPETLVRLDMFEYNPENLNMM